MKRVYAFGKDAHGNNVTEGNTNMKAILGGKGANLAEMANIGLPVPPGFTISCQTCMEYATADNTWPEGALDTIHEYRVDLEERMGKKIGDAQDPLLVSVRSGAPMSMPGMMDTVLNLGLNDQSINGLIAQTENPRFAWDSYRRFIQMFSNVVMGLDGDLFENAITAMKNDRGVASDTDLCAEDLQELVADFKRIFAENVSADEYPNLVVDGAVQFPQDPMVQLQLAIEAVFGSWNNPRAVLYRKQNKIADDLGTAVNVQSMVFGNKGNTSATGVAFTPQPRQRREGVLRRLPGERPGRGRGGGHPQHEPHRRAQGRGRPGRGRTRAGRGVRHPGEPLPRHVRHRVHHRAGQALDAADPRGQAHRRCRAAHRHRDGRRKASSPRKRPSRRVDPEQLDQLLHPQFDNDAAYDVVARGLNAIPGRRGGRGRLQRRRRRGRRRGGPQVACSCAGRPTPTTWPA